MWKIKLQEFLKEIFSKSHSWQLWYDQEYEKISNNAKILMRNLVFTF